MHIHEKCKTVKLNTIQNSPDLKLGEPFLHLTSKARPVIVEMINCTPSNFKTFSQQKPAKEIKRQTIDWEKNCKLHI